MADNRNQRNRVQRIPYIDERTGTQRRPMTEEERRRRAARARAMQKKKRKKRTLMIIAAAILAIIIVVAVILIANGAKNSGKNNGANKDSEEQVTLQTNEDGLIIDEDGQIVEAETTSSGTEIEVIAVGDVIGHDTILEMCNTGTGYDFTSMFEPLKSDISKADVAVVNMETPFGGEEAGPYIGYPAFNTPDEMGLALMDAGFDVVQLASNHTMDSGTVGLDHELDFWSRYTDRIKTVGLYASADDTGKPTIVEKDGVKIAFLNYTYGLNGYELPADRSYMMTLLQEGNEDEIRSQIEAADQEADIVIVCPHWGTEYQVKNNDYMQQTWAALFTEAGADVIIGTHPHVVEKIEWVEAGGNKALCYYSLGNFCSNQQETATVLGGMADFKIKAENGEVYVEEDSAKVIPVVTQNDKTGAETKIATYYLADYTDDMASVHDVKRNTDADFSVEKLQGIVDDVFGASWVKERLN